MKKLKVLLGILLALTLFVSRTSPTRAAEWPFSNLWEEISCVTDINCTIEAASTAAANYVIRVTVGQDFDKITGEDIEAMKNGEWNKGLAAAASKIGSMAYAVPPTGSFVDEVKRELADNILNTGAEAQTVGRDALAPVDTIWGAMRNVAYALFMVVMVAIGFMIILRREMSPRTVVTFTNALPRIILGLVLITFSLPLIALIVDIFSVFASGLVIGVMQGLLPQIETITSEITAGGASEAIAGIMPILQGLGLDALSKLTAIGSLSMLFVTILIEVGALVLFGLAVFRVFSAYVYIVIQTIFSPVIILAGSLPGQEGTITNMGKQLVSKALVFPVTLFMFLLALYFAIYSFAPGTVSALSGEEGLGSLIGNVVFFKIIGPIVVLFMLGAAFKAPALIDSALGLDRPKGKK